MTAATEPRFSVAELKRAWRSLQSDIPIGESYAAGLTPTVAGRPEAGGVIAVLGCAGGVGASTTALALADATDTPFRLLECAPPASSGLAGAATAELGDTGEGWRRGTRNHVQIERISQGALTPSDVPIPVGGDTGACVVDLAWPTESILARPSWLRELLVSAGPLVLVTTATVPGLRRLETTLTLLAEHRDVRLAVAAVIGPRLARWPRQVRHCPGSHTTALERAGRVVAIPCDRRLATTGPDTTPLPPALLTAATAVLELLPTPPRRPPPRRRPPRHPPEYLQ